jgi:ubiquinone/menaquinone biosynthesis C-methylase UbiE
MAVRDKFRPCNFCGEQTKLSVLYQRFGQEIIKCGNCTLVFVSQIPSKEVLGELYDDAFFESSKFSQNTNSPGYRNAEARVRRALILPSIGTARWLDVGCATGDFMLAANKKVQEVHGSDISVFAIERARERGLVNTRVGVFDDLDYPKEHFDLVSMWDLLEHVVDPATTLRKAHATLKIGGYLLISTGDKESFLARITGRFWHLMIPPVHLYFFSKKTIRGYLEKAGFLDIKISYPGKRAPLDFLIEKLFRLINPTFARKIAPYLYKSQLGKIGLPVNLFDIMTISARKTGG